MEEKRQNVYAVVAGIALVGVLVSCLFGALAGGVAGFVVGKQQAAVAIERELEGEFGPRPRFRRDEQPGPPAPMFPGMAGALVVKVIPDTPAADAGLQAGDVIIALDSTPIDTFHRLSDVIQQYQPGDRVTVHVVRGDREDSVLVRLGRHPRDPGQPYLGVRFQMMRHGMEEPGG